MKPSEVAEMLTKNQISTFELEEQVNDLYFWEDNYWRIYNRSNDNLRKVNRLAIVENTPNLNQKDNGSKIIEESLTLVIGEEGEPDLWIVNLDDLANLIVYYKSLAIVWIQPTDFKEVKEATRIRNEKIMSATTTELLTADIERDSTKPYIWRWTVHQDEAIYEVGCLQAPSNATDAELEKIFHKSIANLAISGSVLGVNVIRNPASPEISCTKCGAPTETRSLLCPACTTDLREYSHRVGVEAADKVVNRLLEDLSRNRS